MPACQTPQPPLHHVDQPRRKTPILSNPKRFFFWIESPLVKSEASFFLVIIIYSQHVDKAPTQTLQGIIHRLRGNVAAPQIVQTTGQNPEPITQSGRGGKNLVRAAVFLFEEDPQQGREHPCCSDSSGQKQPRTSEFTVIISRSPRPVAQQHVKLFILSSTFPSLLPLQPIACHILSLHLDYLSTLGFTLGCSGNLCISH